MVNHVVFADPDNQAAKDLQADALEQLGYQAESGPWRNFYLTGAQELRDGVAELPTPNTASPDTVRAMSLDMFFDYLGVRLNGEKAGDAHITLNFDFGDPDGKYLVELENGVLNHTAGVQADDADATITLSRDTLNNIILRRDDARRRGQRRRRQGRRRPGEARRARLLCSTPSSSGSTSSRRNGADFAPLRVPAALPRWLPTSSCAMPAASRGALLLRAAGAIALASVDLVSGVRAEESQQFWPEVQAHYWFDGHKSRAILMGSLSRYRDSNATYQADQGLTFEHQFTDFFWAASAIGMACRWTAVPSPTNACSRSRRSASTCHPR